MTRHFAAWRWRRRLRAVAALCILAALVWVAWGWSGAAPGSADGLSGRARAIDGDSLELTFDAGALAPKGVRTIRLIGIDAPEYRQSCADANGKSWDCGKAARDQLAARVKGQSVSCTVVARDQYQRELARCATAATPDLGEVMVREGWAMSNASIASASGYPVEEAHAARDKNGIWRGTFQNPRDWRDANKLLGVD
jgi:endonuclease YncB( thermonuclease family)